MAQDIHIHIHLHFPSDFLQTPGELRTPQTVSVQSDTAPESLDTIRTTFELDDNSTKAQLKTTMLAALADKIDQTDEITCLGAKGFFADRERSGGGGRG